VGHTAGSYSATTVTSSFLEACNPPCTIHCHFLHEWDFWMLELRDRWMAFRTDIILFCAVVKVTVVTYIEKSVSATQLWSRSSVWGVA
jgi:hypothetical protein